MALDFFSRSLICLDACCIINLAATGRMVEILAASPVRFAVAENVAGTEDAPGEARFVLKGGSGPDRNEEEPIDLQPLVQIGLLTVLRIETDEEAASYVAFAALRRMDEGEAMTCALALHRDGAVASDDVWTRIALRQLAPTVFLYSTSQLIKFWADSCQLAHAELRTVLLDIQQRGNYIPGKYDPLQGWWQTIVNLAEGGGTLSN